MYGNELLGGLEVLSDCDPEAAQKFSDLSDHLVIGGTQTQTRGVIADLNQTAAAATATAAQQIEKKKKLNQYTSGREVVVARTAEQVSRLCERLRESVEASRAMHGCDAAVMGLDVEYCTLEYDIRDG